ncbi:MAG TPA: ABC transporter permease [Actinomycetes bacterium]|nr:ABC transporter permease [Actinomycetes bacterium]
MSTTATSTSTAAPAIDVRQPSVPMLRLVKVELRKLVDTRAGFWLAGSIVIISALITAGMLIWAEPQHLYFGDLFGVMNIPTGVLLPVLAILLVTSEWGQRTGLVTFTLEPRRSRVVVAKLATSLVAAAGAVVVALAFGAVGAVLAGVLRDGAGGWEITGAGLGNSILLQLLALLEGFGFAMLIMNSAAAIVLFFALPTAWMIIASIVPWLHEHVQPWADLATAQTPFQGPDLASASEWAHLGVASVIWIALPLALGIWRLLRAEVK